MTHPYQCPDCARSANGMCDQKFIELVAAANSFVGQRIKSGGYISEVKDGGDLARLESKVKELEERIAALEAGKMDKRKRYQCVECDACYSAKPPECTNTSWPGSDYKACRGLVLEMAEEDDE